MSDIRILISKLLDANSRKMKPKQKQELFDEFESHEELAAGFKEMLGEKDYQAFKNHVIFGEKIQPNVFRKINRWDSQLQALSKKTKKITSLKDLRENIDTESLPSGNEPPSKKDKIIQQQKAENSKIKQENKSLQDSLKLLTAEKDQQSEYFRQKIEKERTQFEEQIAKLREDLTNAESQLHSKNREDAFTNARNAENARKAKLADSLEKENADLNSEIVQLKQSRTDLQTRNNALSSQIEELSKNPLAAFEFWFNAKFEDKIQEFLGEFVESKLEIEKLSSGLAEQIRQAKTRENELHKSVEVYSL